MKTKTAVLVPISAIVFAAAVCIVAFAVISTPVRAEETDKKASETSAPKKEKKSEDKKSDEKKSEDKKSDEKKSPKSNAVVYSYETQAGDSYSKMARKAVQTYGLKNDVKLSGAQIVYAETHLTLDAGSPSLLTGESVSINEVDVKTWVEKAKDLTDEQQAAWEVYTAGVNFNTDNVGERR